MNGKKRDLILDLQNKYLLLYFLLEIGRTICQYDTSLQNCLKYRCVHLGILNNIILVNISAHLEQTEQNV